MIFLLFEVGNPPTGRKAQSRVPKITYREIVFPSATSVYSEVGGGRALFLEKLHDLPWRYPPKLVLSGRQRLRVSHK